MTDYYDRCPACGGLVRRGDACKCCARKAQQATPAETPGLAAPPPQEHQATRPSRAVSLAKVLIYSSLVFFCLVIVVMLAGGVFGSIFGKETSTTLVPTTTIYAVDQVEVLSGLEVEKQSGYIIIHGKVRNAGIYPLEYVEVRGYAKTSSGGVVNTTTSYADSDVLAPGATATFSIYIDDPHNEASKARVEVASAYFQD